MWSRPSWASAPLNGPMVEAPDGTVFAFQTPEALRLMLIEGMDEIDRALADRGSIAAPGRTVRDRRVHRAGPGDASELSS